MSDVRKHAGSVLPTSETAIKYYISICSATKT